MSKEITIISPESEGLISYLKSTLKSTGLIRAFYRRDMKVRYAQTLIGLAWVVIQPVLYLLAFLVAFGTLLDSGSGNVPYVLYPLTGLLAWSYFGFNAQQTGTSLMRSQEIIRKSYFPRIILPLSKAMVGLGDLLVILVFLVVGVVLFELEPTMNWLLIPLPIAGVVLLSIGVGLIISMLSVRYRDVQHLIPLMTHLLLFISPIAYPSSVVLTRLPDSLEWLYYLNPLAGLIDGTRYLLWGESASLFAIVFGLSASMVLCILGLWLYARNDQRLSDEL